MLAPVRFKAARLHKPSHENSGLRATAAQPGSNRGSCACYRARRDRTSTAKQNNAERLLLGDVPPNLHGSGDRQLTSGSAIDHTAAGSSRGQRGDRECLPSPGLAAILGLGFTVLARPVSKHASTPRCAAPPGGRCSQPHQRPGRVGLKAHLQVHPISLTSRAKRTD